MRRDRVSWLKAQGGHRIRLEAATICQLACPSCPTTQGVVKAQLGAGFLRFDQFRRIVVDNIRKVNAYKTRWRSRYPKLLWQMVVFGHNQHEIAAARLLARELDMTFVLKTNWDPDYSPVTSSPAATAGEGSRERQPAADPAVSPERDEAQSDGICYQLWSEPQINFDGALLGCCVNTWGTFGDNALEVGLERALASPGLHYAKEMLLGKAPPKAGIPCTTCAVYAARSRAQRWLPSEPRGGLMRLLQRHGLRRWVVWVDNRLGRYLSPVVRSLHAT